MLYYNNFDSQNSVHILVLIKLKSNWSVYISLFRNIARELNFISVDAPTNVKTEVNATSCRIQWDELKYVREYQITYSETARNSIKLVKVDGNENHVSFFIKRGE